MDASREGVPIYRLTGAGVCPALNPLKAVRPKSHEFSFLQKDPLALEIWPGMQCREHWLPPLSPKTKFHKFGPLNLQEEAMPHMHTTLKQSSQGSTGQACHAEVGVRW